MLTSLAQEILEDLPAEFPDGATVRELQHWLGEPKLSISDAVGELHRAGKVHRNPSGDRWFAGPSGAAHRPQVAAATRKAVGALLDQGKTTGQIMTELGATKGVVEGVSRRRKAGA